MVCDVLDSHSAGINRVQFQLDVDTATESTISFNPNSKLIVKAVIASSFTYEANSCPQRTPPKRNDDGLTSILFACVYVRQKSQGLPPQFYHYSTKLTSAQRPFETLATCQAAVQQSSRSVTPSEHHLVRQSIVVGKQSDVGLHDQQGLMPPVSEFSANGVDIQPKSFGH